MHFPGQRMSRPEYLSTLLMEFNSENRVFVNLLARTAKKSKTNNAMWLVVVGLSEVIGTAMLLFLGCSGAVPGLSSPAPSHLQICLGFGFAVAVIIQIFGHISGAHINPAVTIGALVFKLVSLPAAGMYILAQFIGAIIGYGALMVTIPVEALYPGGSNSTTGFCTTVPSPKATWLQAFLGEYFGTAILLYVCCSVWDKRNATKQDSVPLKFGLTIAVLATVLGPLSGGSLNPARTFAPAVFTGVWDKQWIYWVGPFAAALTTTYFYKFVFDRNFGSPESDQSDIPLNQHNSKVQNIEKLSAEDIATL